LKIKKFQTALKRLTASASVVKSAVKTLCHINRNASSILNLFLAYIQNAPPTSFYSQGGKAKKHSGIISGFFSPNYKNTKCTLDRITKNKYNIHMWAYALNQTSIKGDKQCYVK